GQHIINAKTIGGVGDAVNAQAAGIERGWLGVPGARFQDHTAARIVEEDAEAAKEVRRDHAVRLGSAAEARSSRSSGLPDGRYPSRPERNARSGRPSGPWYRAQMRASARPAWPWLRKCG